ncbi:MAG TPA: ACT domain-containing protein [Mycobacteriales bacterium]|nr:ACT domain-containing protein [Mycobacteriales bacterium]
MRARVSVLDRPGSLLAMTKVIADMGGNIVDIEVLATAEGRVVDDLIVELPSNDPERLIKELANTGAEVLNLRKTVQITGQRADLDLLARVAAHPIDMMATVVSLAPSVWCADWAALATSEDGATPLHATAGVPKPLPTGMPEPMGPLPRRGTAHTANGTTYEVVSLQWGNHHLYIGRVDGPTFLQVELVHLRRVVELASAISAGATVDIRASEASPV